MKDGERSSENGPFKITLPSFQLDKIADNLLYTSSFKNSIYSRFRNHIFLLKSRLSIQVQRPASNLIRPSPMLGTVTNHRAAQRPARQNASRLLIRDRALVYTF
jgi:hypothetical protein